jgi:hypothetical protein
MEVLDSAFAVHKLAESTSFSSGDTLMISILSGRTKALFFGAFLLYLATSASNVSAQVTAFSNFGPGNTYGSFGQTIGGQFINGYKFTSGASGQVSEIDIGIGGSGTFNLNLYSDNSGTLGSSLWSVSGVPVGTGSPNPASILVNSGPTLSSGQNYWLVASGPSPSAFWSPNTTGSTGAQYHQDSASTFYLQNTTLGAFSVTVIPEPSSIALLGCSLAACANYFRRKRN